MVKYACKVLKRVCESTSFTVVRWDIPSRMPEERLHRSSYCSLSWVRIPPYAARRIAGGSVFLTLSRSSRGCASRRQRAARRAKKEALCLPMTAVVRLRDEGLVSLARSKTKEALPVSRYRTLPSGAKSLLSAPHGRCSSPRPLLSYERQWNETTISEITTLKEEYIR